MVALGECTDGTYEAVLMQGSGTFSIEAVLSSAVAPDGKVLVIVNGAYGKRMIQMLKTLKIDHAVLECSEDETPDVRCGR